MKLIPCDTPRKHYYKRCKLQRFLSDFLDMETPCCRVDWEGSYVSVASCSSALRVSCKRMHVGNINVVVSDKTVYLVRTDMVDTKNFGGN